MLAQGEGVIALPLRVTQAWAGAFSTGPEGK
jgi:hypothetical protein